MDDDLLARVRLIESKLKSLERNLSSRFVDWQFGQRFPFHSDPAPPVEPLHPPTAAIPFIGRLIWMCSIQSSKPFMFPLFNGLWWGSFEAD